MIEAMKQALEALENIITQVKYYEEGTSAITSLRQVIAEAEKQKPVAWAMLHDNGDFIDAICPEEHARVEGDYTHPLYTHPQPETEREPDDLTIAYMSGFHDGKKKREWDDPMDTPLPCDVTVGHVTIRKGVALRILVTRMKVLYEMATGQVKIHQKGESN